MLIIFIQMLNNVRIKHPLSQIHFALARTELGCSFFLRNLMSTAAYKSNNHYSHFSQAHNCLALILIAVNIFLINAILSNLIIIQAEQSRHQNCFIIN